MPFQIITVSELPGMIPASLNITRSFTLHNHPSGDPNPSNEDRLITRRLIECGQLIGIHVLDHIIIGADGFISFVEDGLMG